MRGVWACMLLSSILVVGCATMSPRNRSVAVDPPGLEAQLIAAESTHSEIEPLAWALVDSIGPRLTGSSADQAAHAWVADVYHRWGMTTTTQAVDSVAGWERGAAHVDLVSPRARTLAATPLAWSPGTLADVQAEVLTLPDIADAADTAAFDRWLPAVRGRFVLISVAEPSCRTNEVWQKYATPASYERMWAQRDALVRVWARQVHASGVDLQDLPKRLEDAGAAGVVVSEWWPQRSTDDWAKELTDRKGEWGGNIGWGTTAIMDARTTRVPMFDLTCEDYGLVSRLAAHGLHPIIRVNLAAHTTGRAPILSTVAELPGVDRPDEYVVLNTHLDSWDPAGATDNGSGTVVMMEAMRLLKMYYPRPKRTILVRHWSGEEQQGRWFPFPIDDRRDATVVARRTRMMLIQDTGTGRALVAALWGSRDTTQTMAAWDRLAPRLPADLRPTPEHYPRGAGRDACATAPEFYLYSMERPPPNSSKWMPYLWDYGATYHTGRDTYDKLVFDDLRSNAALVAALAYMAASDEHELPPPGC